MERCKKPLSLQGWLEAAEQSMEQAAVYLGHGTDNYWDEAVHLALPVLDIEFDADPAVLQQTLSAESVSKLNQLLDQRITQRIPVPYLTGQAWFAGMPFEVNPCVLIPRSPIAELIENQFRPWLSGTPESILDLCCGGGCIGIACAEYIPRAKVDLTDLSEEALQLAKRNVEGYGLQTRAHCYQGDLFDALPAESRYDVIVSNPPYVDSEDMANLPAEYLHEPRLALAAGDDGLDVVRRILAQAVYYLNDQGILLVEVGNSQRALEQLYPAVPFTWLSFERGGDGVFLLTKEQLTESFPV